MAENDVAKYKVVVIGGSAGSLEVILKILAGIHGPIQQSIVIVVHRKHSSDSILADLLSDKADMPVREVEDKEPVLPATIYIAPPDYHLLFESTSMFALDSSEKMHYSRPSIDVTFESAAEMFGPACVGILLSGANADGAMGLKRIREAGGLAMVQDPATAEVDYMPAQAVKLGAAEMVVEGNKIGEVLRGVIS